MRHLHETASRRAICGVARSHESVTDAHVSRARRSDCLDCRRIYRLMLNLSHYAARPVTIEEARARYKGARSDGLAARFGTLGPELAQRFPGLVDGDTDVNGGDLVQFLAEQLQRGGARAREYLTTSPGR